LSSANNVIEINGKKYDAKTGALIESAKIQPPKVANRPQPTSGVVLDGVVHKTKPNKHTTAQQSHVHHTHQRKTHTLMRSGLKKPVIHSKENSNAPIAIDKSNHERLHRAKTTPRSQQISRFTRLPSFSKQEKPLSVAQPKTTSRKKPSPHHTAQTTPTIKHFEQAINDAQSHLVKYTEKSKRKLFRSKKINTIAASLAVLLLIGFFGFQNAPNLKMRLAARDSGVASAHLPAYTPAGFGVSSHINSQPGKVTIGFKSRTDNRNFTITQTASNWSSDALYANEIASKPNKLTWQEKGKTVYVYDDSNATWVDGGILYNIDNKADLSTDQLLRIINSF